MVSASDALGSMDSAPQSRPPRWLHWIGSLVLCLVTVVVSAALVANYMTPPAQQTASHTASILWSIAAAGGIAVGTVAYLRRRGVSWTKPSPLAALPAHDRPRIRRAIGRRRSFPPEVNQRTAQDTVERLAAHPRWPHAVIMLVLPSWQLLILADPDDGAVGLLLSVALALVLGGPSGHELWLMRRARRRLEPGHVPEVPAARS